MITASQFVSQGQARSQEIQQMISNMGSTFQKHNEGLSELQNAYDQALNELVQINLPELSQQAFYNVRQYTGYGQFDVKNPLTAIEEEHTRLTQLLSDIDNDERYIRREELINPVSGELILKAESIRPNYELLRDGVRSYEAEPRFFRLIQSRYGTSDYTGRVWQLDYYRDWSAGRNIEKKFNKPFYEIRSNYLSMREAYEYNHKEITAAEKEIADVKKLVELREQSYYRLNNLPQVILQESQAALKQHLQYVDKSQLFQWSQGDTVREASIKKVHGIEKKLEYLKEMVSHQQEEETQVLQDYNYKLNRKIAKYQRPKYAYGYVPERDAAILYVDPRDKLYQRRNKFWKSYDDVYGFDDYDYYDYQRDMLWWDLMTDGRDGRYIREVHYYYNSHPGYYYNRDYYYHSTPAYHNNYQNTYQDNYDSAMREIS